MDKDKAKKIIKGTVVALGATYVVLDVVAHHQKKNSIYDDKPKEKNPMEGKKVVFTSSEEDKENADGEKGHLEAVGTTQHTEGVYEKYVKRGMDKVLSFGGLVVLAPVMGTIALAIKLEDPGPVLFTQKRVGKDKQYFKLHKFRSMKMSTPHDVPTHMLENPDQYITKVGKFIRAHSLDELPQIWDIFIGNMSVIGPRPALWNQDLLTAERDRYGANDVRPGLTGWAQINGRDELEIPDKAVLDGKYVEELEKGGIEAAKMDAKCFLGSIHVFGSDDSVVEGGTGEMHKEEAFKVDPDVNAELSLGIVTYNSADEIPILMESLKSSNYFGKMAVYVVDNASTDDSVGIIKRDYPWVHLYESKENLGFGKGHNVIINHVQSKYHIIVNPDIRVEPDTFDKVVEYMDANPDVVVITPFVKNTDGTQQFLPKKNPSMKYMVGGMFEKKSKICKQWRDEYTLKGQTITEPIDVEFCSGCFMITRTAALHEVGGFDERYFLHFEDADLTRELRKVGRAVYNPNITVTHKWERDNKKLNKSFGVALKSMFIYMDKWKGDKEPVSGRKSNYSPSEMAYNAACLVNTKLHVPKARLIRMPITIRGAKYIDFGKNLTTGKNCQIEVNGNHEGGVLLRFGNKVNLGHEVRIQCAEKITIGNNVLMGSRVTIIDNSHGSYSGEKQDSPETAPNERALKTAPISIEDNVWLGDGVVVQEGITIGKGSIIGANSVVTKDIPSMCIAVGSPARVIKRYDKEKREWVKIG